MFAKANNSVESQAPHNSVRRVSFASAVVLAISLSLAAGFRAITKRSDVANSVADEKSRSQYVQAMCDNPLRVGPLIKPVFPQNSPEARSVAQALSHPPGVALDGASLCHLLRAYGQGVIPREDITSGDEAIAILSDQTIASQYFNEPMLLETRNGLRYRLDTVDARANQPGESHRDQCLAAFAELGLPLKRTVRTLHGVHSIRDLLTESVATFTLNEEEITWTAMAYCLYLAPQRSWCNRDGQQFSFDDLAKSLLQRPLQKASCGGTHLLMAMSLIIRADDEYHIISPPTRNMLVGRIRLSVDAAVKAQTHDGFWSLGWDGSVHVSRVIQNLQFNKLAITGHVLEWLEYLPVDLQPEQQVYVRAADWLCGQLITFSRRDIESYEFCPWTHSVCGVRNLVEPIKDIPLQTMIKNIR